MSLIFAVPQYSFITPPHCAALHHTTVIQFTSYNSSEASTAFVSHNILQQGKTLSNVISRSESFQRPVSVKEGRHNHRHTIRSFFKKRITRALRWNVSANGATSCWIGKPKIINKRQLLRSPERKCWGGGLLIKNRGYRDPCGWIWCWDISCPNPKVA